MQELVIVLTGFQMVDRYMTLEEIPNLPIEANFRDELNRIYFINEEIFAPGSLEPTMTISSVCQIILAKLQAQTAA